MVKVVFLYVNYDQFTNAGWERPSGWLLGAVIFNRIIRVNLVWIAPKLFGFASQN